MRDFFPLLGRTVLATFWKSIDRVGHSFVGTALNSQLPRFLFCEPVFTGCSSEKKEFMFAYDLAMNGTDIKKHQTI